MSPQTSHQSEPFSSAASCSRQYAVHTVPRCTRQNQLSPNNPEPKPLSLMSPPRGQHMPRGLACLWDAEATFSCGSDGHSSSHSLPSPVFTVHINSGGEGRGGMEGRDGEDRSGDHTGACSLRSQQVQGVHSCLLLGRLCLGVRRWEWSLQSQITDV